MFGSAKVSGTRGIGTEAATVEASEVPPPPVATTAVAPAAIAGTAIDGDWQMTMVPPMGPQQEMVATFRTEGGSLTGKLAAPEGTQEFTGTVNGNRLKWELKVTEPMAITLKYDLTIDGDAISGKCKLGMFGSAKVTGRRLQAQDE
jgi:carbon-monoxide dehydrogenase large subunit